MAGRGQSKYPAEKDQFDVILESEGNRPNVVSKRVRDLKGLSLWQSVNLVGSAPQLLLEHVHKETALRAKAELEAVGATVTVK